MVMGSDPNGPGSGRDVACRAVAAELAVRYGWQLLAADELARRAARHLAAGLGRGPAEAVLGAYCVALHAACAGAEGAPARERAFGELGDYLYSLACLRRRDLSDEQCEEATQGALERVVRTISQCRQPVAFLAFAAQHLLDSARQVRRQARAAAVSLEQSRDVGEDGAVFWLAGAGPDPAELVEAEQRLVAISQLLDEFLRDHPRATRQVGVLRLALLDDLDDTAIGARLGLRLGSVYTARSRIQQALRAEPKWQARARELGLLPDEL
jgi:DNA-directed RNA polymerase specialized sigma24 family protein